jgi:hypothetical protein
MADPITWTLAGWVFKAAVVEITKMVVNKQIDHMLLQQFVDAYERLPDKRRSPGPKLRKVIAVLKSSEVGQARAELKSFARECMGLTDEPGLLDLGVELLNMLALCP